jgi:alcohol dehydrogenase class IV
MTDAFCRQGLTGAASALVGAYHDGSDRQARRTLSLAALFSGLALANGGLGAVHGIAGPLGGMLEAPHGALCAALLPHVLAVNLSAIKRSASQDTVLERFDELARLMTGSPKAGADDGISWLRGLITELHIPPLSHWGMTPDRVPELATKAARASSMKGNPARLSSDEVEDIIRRAL